MEFLCGICVETVTALWTNTSGSSVISWFLNQLVSNMINKIMIRALREYGYLKVRVCANVFKKKKLNEACVYSSFLVNEDTSLVSHILFRFKIIIIIKKKDSQIEYFQHFKVYLNFIFHTVSSFQQSHSIRCSMQKKEKKRFSNLNLLISPHKLKRTQVPQRKVALTN